MIENFVVFGRTFGIYPIMSLIGIFICGIYACKKAQKYNLNDNDMIVLLLVAAVGVWIGGHLLYGVTNVRWIVYLMEHREKIHTVRQFAQYVFYLFGGTVFYGGLIGGIASSLIYARKKRWNIRLFSDILAPTVPLFHVFGRIGCFLSGCCYGVECGLGFIYRHSPIPQANGVMRFPVQLLESLFNLFLFLLLSYLLKKGVWKGRLFLVYLLSYAVGRFFLEFLRGDQLRGSLWCFSTSQWISLILVITCPVIIVILNKKQKRGNR